MTTALKNSATIDMKHLAIQAQQLKDNNGNAVDMADVVTGVAAGSFPVVSAGGSGTAGDVDIYPTTASKGKTRLSASDNTGNTTTTINTAAQAGARTYTVPDAGASASFVMTAGPLVNRSTVAAAGSNVGNAGALAVGYNTVTAGDGTKGVVLPTAPTAGTIVFVKNNAAAVLKVYPDAAATVNAIGSNGAISMASLTSAIFIADSTTQWFTIPLLPS